MYFSPNRKASLQRANDEYLRRSATAGGTPRDDSVPTVSRPPEPVPPPAPSPAPDNDQSAPCPASVCAPSLAMVYCPKQAFDDLYDVETALARGTLFGSLDLPFEGRGIAKR